MEGGIENVNMVSINNYLLKAIRCVNIVCFSVLNLDTVM